MIISLGLIAEVEYLWSLCKYIYTNIRKKIMTPASLSNCICYGVSKEYCDLDVVPRIQQMCVTEETGTQWWQSW